MDEFLKKIKKINGLPEDLKERLLHVMLSHNGYKELVEKGLFIIVQIKR